MTKLISISPFKCRMWRLHDRLDTYLTEETCKSEILSFEKHGQLVPALGRPLVRDMEHEVELIYGARRLFVARHINVPLLVELRDLSDTEAVIAMDIENRLREDVSPYERGMSYARWLRSGLFKSQDEISRAIRISASQVSRLLRLAHLPAAIVGAFKSPCDICETWGLRLMDALENEDRRAATLKVARELQWIKPRPPAAETYRRLLSASSQGRRLTLRTRDEVVKDGDGAPIFRIRHHRDSLAFIVPLNRVSAWRLDVLRESMCDALLENEAHALAVPSRDITSAQTHAEDSTVDVRDDVSSGPASRRPRRLKATGMDGRVGYRDAGAILEVDAPGT